MALVHSNVLMQHFGKTMNCSTNTEERFALIPIDLSLFPELTKKLKRCHSQFFNLSYDKFLRVFCESLLLYKSPTLEVFLLIKEVYGLVILWVRNKFPSPIITLP
jgi:hypothetical protein